MDPWIIIWKRNSGTSGKKNLLRKYLLYQFDLYFFTEGDHILIIQFIFITLHPIFF